MGHFKFLLDHGVKHLAHCFPAKRVVTTEELGLPETTPDDEIIAAASQNNYLLIAANRKDFESMVPAYIKTSTKKADGCRRFYLFRMNTTCKREC
jgi:predicted nuclease of predicted toxin-antitoxin system